MQTLGLASEQKPTDGLLKRLFWPTIENQHDVDLVRQQGFWLCTVFAVLSIVISLFSGPWWVAAVLGSTYFLAGMGVREGDVAAAVMIFVCFFLDRVIAVEAGLGGGSPVVGLFSLALLLSNVRATLLSRRWSRSASGEEAETVDRPNTSLVDKLANQMPAAVWPKGQYVFFPLAAGLLLFSLFAIVRIPQVQKSRARQSQRQQQIEINTP